MVDFYPKLVPMDFTFLVLIYVNLYHVSLVQLLNMQHWLMKSLHTEMILFRNLLVMTTMTEQLYQRVEVIQLILMEIL